MRLIRSEGEFHQFYGDRSGNVADPFGHAWIIATHIHDVEPREMQRRAEEFFGGEASQAKLI